MPRLGTKAQNIKPSFGLSQSNQEHFRNEVVWLDRAPNLKWIKRHHPDGSHKHAATNPGIPGTGNVTIVLLDHLNMDVLPPITKISASRSMTVEKLQARDSFTNRRPFVPIGEGGSHVVPVKEEDCHHGGGQDREADSIRDRKVRCQLYGA